MPPPMMIDGWVLGSEFTDELHYSLYVFYRGFRQDAMTEVKDMARAGAGTLEDFVYLGFDLRQRSEERYRVEIALNGRAIGDVHPCLVDVHAPVNTHDVAAGGVEFTEEARAASAEVDDGDA